MIAASQTQPPGGCHAEAMQCGWCDVRSAELHLKCGLWKHGNMHGVIVKGHRQLADCRRVVLSRSRRSLCKRLDDITRYVLFLQRWIIVLGTCFHVSFLPDLSFAVVSVAGNLPYC